jgi:hypothetical protein
MSLVSGLELACCGRRGGLSRIWLVERTRAPIDPGTNAMGYEGYDSEEVVEWTVGGLGDTITSFPSLSHYNAGWPASGKESDIAWFEFEFNRETAGFKADAVTENGSTNVELELEFYIPKVTQKVQNRLNQLIEACNVYALVEMYDDDKCWTDGQLDEDRLPIMPTPLYYILGYDKVFEDKAYLQFSEGEQETGLDLQDANGTRVVLKGIGAQFPYPVRIKINNDNTNATTNGYMDFWQPVTGTELTWFSN